MPGCYICSEQNASSLFPQDEQRLKMWLNCLDISVPPANSSRICTKHFKDSDIMIQ